MIKLIQANIWGGALQRPLNSFLKAQQADLLMLQEVTSSPEGKSSYFDALQEVEEHSKLPETFFFPKIDYSFAGKKVYYGNAILSRFPLIDTHGEFTHLDYQADSDPAMDDYNVRAFQHAVIDLPNGKKINLINYHGYHLHAHKDGNEETDRHCQRIAAYIATLKGPVILSGDFNLAPDSGSLKPLNELLRNLCIVNNVTTTRNQFARSQTVVDYIWVGADVQVHRFAVLPDLVSDHAALLLEFEV